jgi:hypothetical protein
LTSPEHAAAEPRAAGISWPRRYGVALLAVAVAALV